MDVVETLAQRGLAAPVGNDRHSVAGESLFALDILEGMTPAEIVKVVAGKVTEHDRPPSDAVAVSDVPEVVLVHGHVGVQEGDHLEAGCIGSSLPRLSGPEGFVRAFEVQHAHPEITLQLSLEVPARAVIDDDHLMSLPRVGLLRESPHHLSQDLDPVARGHDDRDSRIRVGSTDGVSFDATLEIGAAIEARRSEGVAVPGLGARHSEGEVESRCRHRSTSNGRSLAIGISEEPGPKAERPFEGATGAKDIHAQPSELLPFVLSILPPAHPLMGGAMRADAPPRPRRELSQLSPAQNLIGFPDEVCRDEDGGRDTELFDHRGCDVKNRRMSVIEGDGKGSGSRLLRSEVVL